MKKSTIYSFTIGIVVMLVLAACEDKIQPNLDDADPVLVVDAWINNKATAQIVTLNYSQPYLNNETPQPLIGATVTITEEGGKVYAFTDAGDGTYRWIPPSDQETFGLIGSSYSLTINTETETYTAVSEMFPVPVVDSITYELEEESAFSAERYAAEFWSRDLEGEGNTYWIRTYWNGQELSKPDEMNVAYDAAFSEGGTIDGLIFIPPIRQAITPDDEEDDNGDAVGALKDGDSLLVEIHSITKDAFDFLVQVNVQTNRPGGFGELFAQPLSNVPTNIVSSNANIPVLGFFNVSAVEGNSRVLKVSELE